MRRTRNAKKPVKEESEPNRDIDAVLDMIDQRISSLLIKSSEIQSKLDAREGKSSKIPPEFSFSILQSPAKPTARSTEMSPVMRKSPVRASPVRQEKSPEPRPRASPPSKISVSSKVQKKDTIEIADLVATIQNLVNEVQEMKEEQRSMSDKICEMHTMLMQTHGKLDEGYEYSDDCQ